MVDVTQPDATESSTTVAHPSPLRGYTALCVALLLLTSFGTYALNFDDYFVGDDFDIIVSFYDKPASYFFELLYNDESGDVWAAMAVPDTGYLRPVKIWLMKLDFMIWGANPLGFRITALTVFALNVILVFFVFKTLLPDRLPFTFLGAWIVAIHPVYSEIVPLITFREETLALCFMLLAFQMFLRHRLSGGSWIGFYVCYVLAMLTKESGITIIGLVVAYDGLMTLTSGRPRDEAQRRLVFYLPALLVIPAYFALRWFAFGSLIADPSGDSGRLFSPEAFVEFHWTFVRFLLDRSMFDLHGVPYLGPVMVLASLGVLLTLFLGRHRIPRQTWVMLVFVGPVWYAATTAILHGVYFAARHNVLPIIGIVMFVTALAGEIVGFVEPRWHVPAVIALMFPAVFLFLAPTLSMSQVYSQTSEIVERVRADIERQTAHIPAGSTIHLDNVPQIVKPPYYFGWALQSALKLPFTSTDLANRCLVFNARNWQLNYYKTPVPRQFDFTLRLQETWPPPIKRDWDR